MYLVGKSTGISGLREVMFKSSSEMLTNYILS